MMTNNKVAEILDKCASDLAKEATRLTKEGNSDLSMDYFVAGGLINNLTIQVRLKETKK